MNKENSQAQTQTVNEQPCEVVTSYFSAQKSEIRNVFVNGEPYFVGSDVANALGYANSRKALSDHCRYVTKSYIPHPQNPEKKLEVSVIPEGDVFRLIMKSTLPSAQTFECWVMDEVLPSLRKKGYYGVNRKPDNGGYIDARNEPFQTKNFNGYNVRHISIDGQTWFSVNDLNRALHSSTSSNQLAKKLNVIETLAIKIWLFGNTHPAWFTNARGARLTLSGSRINNGMQLMIGGLTE